MMARFFLRAIFILHFGIVITHALIHYDPKSNGPVVTLSTGSVEGRFVQTDIGARAFVFQGVPYVEPPLGNLRFAKPVPKKPWSGTIMAKEYKPACPQNATISPQDLLDEDCVYMNIFAGIHCTDDNLCPVIYYIHGGGYEFDSVRMFPPDVLVENFADNGLVFVLVSYRLGVLGFFSTGTDDAVGNWAIEDMIEGARWIQREIHHFGGDKNKVTVQGHSSSAHAVSLLTLTPKTEGLFHQAIIMSGGSDRQGSFNNDISDFKTVSIKLGCATKMDWAKESKYKAIVECMRTIPSEFLINTFNEVRCCDETVTRSIRQIGTFIIKEVMNLELPTRITSPRNDGPNGIFPKPLSQMVAERRPVPTMTGTTSNEGSGSSKQGFPNATGYTVAMMCNFIAQDYKHPIRIGRECKKQYVLLANPKNATSPFNFWAEQIGMMFDDVNYFVPCFKEASTIRSTGAKVYLYSFDYEKVGMEGMSPWHSFDLTYLVGIHPFEFDKRDHEIKKIYVPLFVNYAKYGNPTPADPNASDTVVNWVPLENPDGFNYLSVNLPTEMKPDYHKNGILFWTEKVDEIENEWSILEKKIQHVTPFSHSSTEHSTDNPIEQNNGFDYQTAFWVVFSLLIATIAISIVIFVYFYRRKSRRSGEMTHEERALLGSLKYADSYNSLDK